MTQDPAKRRGLGRGLDSLLPAPSAPVSSADRSEKGVFQCALEKISPQKGQPRQHFDDAALEELAESIRVHGLLEPIVVRRSSPGADKFEIIAGERRWRACQKAGLRDVLVVVKDVSSQTAFELALIENVQREDLNPVELAEALDRLVKDYAYTQETLAERLGKDRTTISNSLRLLKLPERIRSKVIVGELTEGHARALLGAGDSAAIEDLADKVLRGKLTVRATEALVRSARSNSASGAKGKGAKESDDNAYGEGKSANVRDLELRLTRALGTKVEVRDSGNKGEVAIPYADLDALDRLLERVLNSGSSSS